MIMWPFSNLSLVTIVCSAVWHEIKKKCVCCQAVPVTGSAYTFGFTSSGKETFMGHIYVHPTSMSFIAVHGIIISMLSILYKFVEIKRSLTVTIVR
jgi:hypothetical protein